MAEDALRGAKDGTDEHAARLEELKGINRKMEDASARFIEVNRRRLNWEAVNGPIPPPPPPGQPSPSGNAMNTPPPPPPPLPKGDKGKADHTISGEVEAEATQQSPPHMDLSSKGERSSFGKEKNKSPSPSRTTPYDKSAEDDV